jgi:hypothetical protein
VREQGVNAGAVEVRHAGQVDDEDDEPALLRSGEQRVAEPAGVAHVDLAHGGHDRDPVRAGPGGELKRSGHH